MEQSISAIATLVSALLGGLFTFLVYRYVIKDADKQKHYSDLDNLSLEVLKLGVAYPDLRDPSRTKDYRTTFTQGEYYRYDAYAYIVWNMCETIYDKCRKDKHLWKTWEPVLWAENKLHREWLEDNQDKFKYEFLQFLGVVVPSPGSPSHSVNAPRFAVFHRLRLLFRHKSRSAKSSGTEDTRSLTPSAPHQP